VADLPPEVLDAVISAQLAPGSGFSRVARELLTPMRVAMDEAASVLERPLAVYWIDEGIPEMFSRPLLRPAPIGFSGRYVEVSADLYRLARLDLGAGDLSALSESVCLELMAELTLKRGDHSLAAYLAARAELVSPGVGLAPSSIAALEHEPRNEHYMAVWFFGLLHEIGHVYAQDVDLAELRDGVDLPARVASAMAGAQIPAELVAGLGGDRTGSLDPAVLSEEIAADRFAVATLVASTARVLQIDGAAGVDVRSLTQAILDQLNVLAIFNRCAAVVQQATRVADLRSDPWVNVSYQVRAQLVAEAMARNVAYLEDRDEDAVLDAIVERNSRALERGELVEQGLARAMRQVLWPEEREADVLERLREARGGGSAAALSVGLRRFVALARRLGSEHHDVRLVASLLEGAATPAEAAYLALWVRRDGGASHPFVVPIDGRYVVFVFRGAHELFQYFRDESARGLRPDVRLETAAVMAHAEWEVHRALHAELPAELRSRAVVVIEGTPQFDAQIDRLAAGAVPD
jgi:hypothetical protein